MGCSSSGAHADMLLTARRLSQQAKTYRGLEGDFPCVIPEPHMRGIAIPQLKVLLRFARARCAEEQWLDRDPMKLGSRVKPEDINLYHLVEYVVKPSTAMRRVSYVEFASSHAGDQVPEWFVSHFWGERVSDFIVCLDLFRDRHVLHFLEAFWICAYALRQNPPGPEIGTGSPNEEPFARALTMQSVKGTVMILDQPLAVFTRAWCTFEGTLTLQSRKRLDLVVSQSVDATTVAQMIADGPTKGDNSPAVQEQRDQAFPLEVAERGMNISIQDATATKVEDVNRILNCIANGRSGTSAPPYRHENYERYNMAIREKFAAVVLRVAIATGAPASVRRALRAVPEVALRSRDAHGRTYLEAAKDVAKQRPKDQARQDIADYLQQAMEDLGFVQKEPKAMEDLGFVQKEPKAADTCVCGSEFIDDEPFCGKCGQCRYSDETCSSCGNIFPDETNFCRLCGQRRPGREVQEIPKAAAPFAPSKQELPPPIRFDITWEPESPPPLASSSRDQTVQREQTDDDAELLEDCPSIASSNAGFCTPGDGAVNRSVPFAVKGRRQPTSRGMPKDGQPLLGGEPSQATTASKPRPLRAPQGEATRLRTRSQPGKQLPRTNVDNGPRFHSAAAAVGQGSGASPNSGGFAREASYRSKRSERNKIAMERPRTVSPAATRLEFYAPNDRV